MTCRSCASLNMKVKWQGAENYPNSSSTSPAFYAILTRSVLCNCYKLDTDLKPSVIYLTPAQSQSTEDILQMNRSGFWHWLEKNMHLQQISRVYTYALKEILMESDFMPVRGWQRPWRPTGESWISRPPPPSWYLADGVYNAFVKVRPICDYPPPGPLAATWAPPIPSVPPPHPSRWW